MPKRREDVEKEWGEFVAVVSKREGVDFYDTKEMLFYLYERFKSSRKVGVYLGCSNTTVLNKMRELNLVRTGKGGFRRSVDLRPSEFGYANEEQMLRDMVIVQGESIRKFSKYLEDYNVKASPSAIFRRLKAIFGDDWVKLRKEM